MIDFCTNEELINELMKRKTFVGIVISANDFRSVDNGTPSDFRVYGNGLLESEAKNLLSFVVNHLDD